MPDQDIALMAHLMRRAGFGAHRDQLERLVEKGYEQVVDELVEPDKYDVPRVDQDLIIRFHPGSGDTVGASRVQRLDAVPLPGQRAAIGRENGSLLAHALPDRERQGGQPV